MVRLKIKKLSASAKVPSIAYHGDAGFDVYSDEDKTLAPGEHYSFATGIAMEVPPGFVALVWDKSGLSHKFALKTLGGVIDEGFRGECKIGLINLGREEMIIKKGDKLAQVLIQKVEKPEIKEVASLSKTERGERGFGSSGK